MPTTTSVIGNVWSVSVQYGTGRLFIQGPSEHDVEILRRREEDIHARRLEEEGEEGMLDVGEWAVYDDLETVRSLLTLRDGRSIDFPYRPDRRIRCLAQPERCARIGFEEHYRKVVAPYSSGYPTPFSCELGPPRATCSIR